MPLGIILPYDALCYDMPLPMLALPSPLFLEMLFL